MSTSKKIILWNVLINGMLIVVSATVGIILFEVNHRWIVSPNGGNILPPYYFRTDPQTAFDHQENFRRGLFLLKSEKKQVPVWTNELGCFDKPVGNLQDYVLMVGDSFTFSYSRYQDKWGTIAEGLTGQRILKCGVGGFGLRQSLMKAKRVIEKVGKPPKLIIVGYHIGSDLVDDYMLPNGTVIDGYRAGSGTEIDLATGKIRKIQNAHSIKQEVKNFLAHFTCDADCSFPKRVRFWLRLHSASYNLVADALKSIPENTKTLSALSIRVPSKGDHKTIIEGRELSLEESPEVKSVACAKAGILQLQQVPYYQGDDFPWIEQAWEKHLVNITDFRQLAKQYHASLLFVLFPDKQQVSPSLINQSDYYRMFTDFDLEAPNRRLQEFLEREGIAYLDLLKPFRHAAALTPELYISGRNLYLKSDGHLSERGDHLAGILLANTIIIRNLIAVDHTQSRLDTIHRKLSAFMPDDSL
jgi:hypothetical protein